MARRRFRPSSRCIAALGIALVLPWSAAAATASKKQPGAESPQALVARFKAAAAKDDFLEVVDCIDPASRRELAGGLVLGTTMMVAFMGMGSEMAAGMAEGVSEGMSGGQLTAEQKAQAEKAKAQAKQASVELQARHEAIMQRYGLDQRMKDMQAAPDAGGGSPEEAMGKLLKGIDDRALIADLMGFMEDVGKSQGGENKKPMDIPEITEYKIDGDHATGKAGDETVKFVRVDGRWYLVPEKKGPAAGGPPTP
jgi:hypothetical protein